MKIEDYGLIGDTHTTALVGRNGSIDWLCVPHFDSAACFASLLGKPEHGYWKISPDGEITACRRRYRPSTLILETEFETPSGCVRLTDCMPPRGENPVVVRLVEGLQGTVAMKMELAIRFDYGATVPWVRRIEDRLVAVAGSNGMSLWSGVETHGKAMTTVAEFSVSAGERVPFALAWHPSHESPKGKPDAADAIAQTEDWWTRWIRQANCPDEWKEPVERSLLTLKALTFAPTGGIVAAPTTSLPENPGGVRNWDYRICWLRDATFTLYSLLHAGFTTEARAWRDWLLRAVAGDPSKLQIMYGLRGERWLNEVELPWLPGYEASAPVRVGNAASNQFQLDVYGELIDAMHQARCAGEDPNSHSWDIQRAVLDFLETAWHQPDEGIWEVRGPRRHFTHSKIMAWVAFERAAEAVRKFGLEGPAERWDKIASNLHAEICAKGFHPGRNAFTQEYGSDRLDASLLMAPLVGFLPPSDSRIRGTLQAIERELLHDGFVQRYLPLESEDVDGLPPGEASFLPCTFWLADNYALAGRCDEAREVFQRLLDIRNDLGLLSEEYHPKARRLLGNFPQAFSHVGLINTAHNICSPNGPAQARSRGTKAHGVHKFNPAS